MATINFYLDSEDKKGLCPIHLKINCGGEKIKVATGLKIAAGYWDKIKQSVRLNSKEYNIINSFLSSFKNYAENVLAETQGIGLTKKEIKIRLSEFVSKYKEDNSVKILREDPMLNKKRLTFIDLFAGAGGFSEGFLQVDHYNFLYDFLLASDINENCDLTHRLRYNHQLGLQTKFLRQDISEPDFLDNLLKEIGNQKVDIVCGGPPCQSFSLAGKRKKFDKKDDLFSHYLRVISELKPKYFVMENVRGILTKESGKVKDMIIREIKSLIDVEELPSLITLISSLKKKFPNYADTLDSVLWVIKIQSSNYEEQRKLLEDYLIKIEKEFTNISSSLFDYHNNKTNDQILTIKHGIYLLQKRKELEYIKRDIIRIKDHCYLDNDEFVNDFNSFLDVISIDEIISRIKSALKQISSSSTKNELENISQSLDFLSYTIDECFDLFGDIASKTNTLQDFNTILENTSISYRLTNSGQCIKLWSPTKSRKSIICWFKKRPKND